MPKKFDSVQELLADRTARGLPRDFCLVPFTTLILEPDGWVGSCRQKGSEFPVGDIRNQDLDEIWNGRFMRTWRREFLKGEPKICKSEVRQQACHMCTDYNSMLPETAFEEIQTKGPIRLALNFNGQCNLQCQMCHIWQKPNGLYDEIGFWKKLEKYIPGLQEVELLSGEPFIQKDTYRLIDLISARNPNCLWTITTNAHWKLTDRVRRALDKIRFKNLIISLDSLNPLNYSKIRRGGTLTVPLRNLSLLKEYESSRIERGLGALGMRINFLVQKDNWMELGDFHEFEKTTGIRAFRTFLYEPEEHSLLTLNERSREEILEYYLKNLRREQLTNSMRVLLPLLDSLPIISRSAFFSQIRDRLNPDQNLSLR